MEPNIHSHYLYLFIKVIQRWCSYWTPNFEWISATCERTGGYTVEAPATFQLIRLRPPADLQDLTWLVVEPPLCWKIWKSVGMIGILSSLTIYFPYNGIIYNDYSQYMEKKWTIKHVPNHQPVTVVSSCLSAFLRSERGDCSEHSLAERKWRIKMNKWLLCENGHHRWPKCPLSIGKMTIIQWISTDVYGSPQKKIRQTCLMTSGLKHRGWERNDGL